MGNNPVQLTLNLSHIHHSEAKQLKMTDSSSLPSQGFNTQKNAFIPRIQ
jgi:hypothetical protein